ncbi:hypothetical protein EOE67_11090 [Rheinheimera riviphila]|uniref:Uncharacterized protein n=1 Tax=Rheinheimera riviphila TaxID=1834037 RepID=A0A437QRK2_9GAMM|nr:hypothetical protein [Rheinheimera riviphila]RVU37136.1 hypothetical protein EOE67_11090 [Rheinheimera riviphila]
MSVNFIVKPLISCLLFTTLSGCIKNVEENPVIELDKFFGEYHNSREVLIINPDRTYSIKTDSVVDAGRWSLNDSNVTLSANKSRIVYIKVYEVDGAYQLIIQDKKPQDPDTYDWSRVMIKVE